MAHALGVSLVTSASIMQGQLSRNLPEEIKKKFDGLETKAQCSLRFVRSTPGVTTALVGMGQAKHAQENLKVAKVNPIRQCNQFEPLCLSSKSARVWIWVWAT